MAMLVFVGAALPPASAFPRARRTSRLSLKPWQKLWRFHLTENSSLAQVHTSHSWYQSAMQ